MTQPEQRQALVDTFINAIYKEGTEMVAFGEAVKAEKSSDMSAQGAPDIKRQIERFGVFFFFFMQESGCTLSAHRLHICPNRGCFCAWLAQPAFLITRL